MLNHVTSLAVDAGVAPCEWLAKTRLHKHGSNKSHVPMGRSSRINCKYGRADAGTQQWIHPFTGMSDEDELLIIVLTE